MIAIKEIGGLSEKGVRPQNEDFIRFSKSASAKNRIFVLCDGMGGHGHGEVASQTVGNAVGEYLESLAKEQITAADLQDALDRAQAALTAADTFADAEKKMGTTLVVAVINRMHLLVGHVGDSRAYLFSKDGVRKFRSKDHSKVGEAIEAEILTEEEARTSPYKNVLTRCVMAGRQGVEIEVDELQVEEDDCLLLCTDGVVDAMDDKEISGLLIDRPVADSLDCIRQASMASSHDNFSAILLRLSQDEAYPRPKAATAPKARPKNEPQAYCPACGAANRAAARYCNACGQSLPSATRPARKDTFNAQKPDQSAPEHSDAATSRKRPWWTLLVFACAFFSVAGYLSGRYVDNRPDVEKEKEILAVAGRECTRIDTAVTKYVKQTFRNDTIVCGKDTIRRQLLLGELKKCMALHSPDTTSQKQKPK